MDGGNVILRAGARSSHGESPNHSKDGEFRFELADGTVVMKFTPDGRIFVHGREAATELETVEAFREWFRHAHVQYDPGGTEP